MPYKNIEEAIERDIQTFPLREQREAVKRYNEHNTANGLKGKTRKLHAFCLQKLAQFCEKPFEDITKDDLIRFAVHLEKSFKPNTKSTVLTHVKRFYKWLQPDGDEYPKKVKSIVIRKNGNELTQEDLLTHDEILRMVRGCDNPRNRAILMVLWETGARAAEFLRMTIASVRQDKVSKIVTLKGKTGSRQRRLIKSQPYLEEWLNMHPDPTKRDNPLWPVLKVNVHHKKGEMVGLKHNALIEFLQRASERAGIQKKVYPHLLRHTKATEDAQNYKEAELRILYGWTPGSNMPATYIHLSQRDTLDREAEEGGLKKPDKKEDSPLQPWECAFCKRENPSTNVFCGNCGRTTDLAVIQEIDDLIEDEDEMLDSFLQDPRVRALAKEYFSEKNDE